MRFTIIILLTFVVLVFETFGRPSQVAENDSEEETVYEGKEDLPADYINDSPSEKESQELDSLSPYKLRRAENQEINEDDRSHVFLKHSSDKSNEYENILEDKPENGKRHILLDQGIGEDMSLFGKNKFNTNLETEENGALTQQGMPNSRFNAYKRHEENSDVEKSDDIELSSDDRTMLEDDRRLSKDWGEYNNEAIEEEPQYKRITYYNKVRGDVYQKRKPNSILNSNRDRRQAGIDRHEKNVEKKIDSKQDEGENIEDNESAIKRNINKLSREELEDLLNSLSEDKKALLKKIIENKIINENINKREITKKAGVVEENCLESGQSDVNKIESGSSIDSISSMSQSDTTETTKQSDGGEVSKSKSSESDSSSKTDDKDELSDVNVAGHQEIGHDEAGRLVEPKSCIEKETLKIENKREAHSQDLLQDKPEMNQESSLYGHYDLGDNEMNSEKDDNWSELLKDESELHKSYSNLYKRGLNDYINSADVKSLEESFPYYDAINTKSSDSHMSPLIRVKRTNSNVIKRASGHCTDMKVPFFPGALNDDAYDNEKDEFEDGGIFEKSYERVGKESNQHIKEISNSNDHLQRSNKNLGLKSKNYSQIKSEIDSTNIGSDTDNILSNVESVDDNLMYTNNNNGLRKKRVADTSNINQEIESVENDLLPETASSFIDDNVPDGILKKNLARYQENDAFGSIPRSSDEEVARYKRIRRLKQAPTIRENLPNTE